ncbi:MAG TPA: hypothetical protein VGB85_01265 [Nannocystis sp.]|jgi:hypothetical protein
MRFLARSTLASTLLFACGDNGDMQITQTNPTSLDTGGSSGTSGMSGASMGDTTTTGQTSTPPTTDPTTDELTTEPLTTGPTTAPTTDASTSEATTEATTDGSSGDSGGVEDLMKVHGHACGTDDDCKALLGPDGICQKDILGVYSLPGGYCTTYCQLPDQQTTYQLDSRFCTLGADCVGLMGYFEACAHVCTDTAQCPREGYECRQMPQISNPDDPKFCLMTEDNMIPP